MQDAGPDTRSFRTLFSQLAADLSLLLRQEARLAKGEYREMFIQVALGLAVLLVGSVLAGVGLVALLCAIVLALALVMPYWAAALVMGLIFAILGALALYLGVKRLRHFRLLPERTARSLRATAAMVRERLS